MVRTPITDLPVGWRRATGHDDLLLVEGGVDLATAVRVVDGRALLPPYDDGRPRAAGQLPVGDVDALVVALRVSRLGDRMIAEGACGRCGARVDVDFGLADYVAHRRPRRSRAAEPDTEPGWWRLRGTDTVFRLPTADDVLAATDGGPAALRQACVRGTAPTAAVERVMAVLAPVLRTTVTGACPECGQPVELDVDVRALCLAELGFLAGAVLDEVHLLAAAYHWGERAILDLPGERRHAYAERIRLSAGAAVEVTHV
ncbi:hypothetical protein Cs7R123_48410 [Catellatospora sp. TT07R-123]|uniref:hypothetical protein n=1 Tax=Catellatospora sp. TT07R-123 TaxID=2733863 RepID=UPI001B24B346|nr:hypothetical protein [Catellatospora sp. TT07R-123]GHJ47499.1 hypothetical protein Cs7R123_48410 [Catellatospora sp. TT07R-123]